MRPFSASSIRELFEVSPDEKAFVGRIFGEQDTQGTWALHLAGQAPGAAARRSARSADCRSSRATRRLTGSADWSCSFLEKSLKHELFVNQMVLCGKLYGFGPRFVTVFGRKPSHLGQSLRDPRFNPNRNAVKRRLRFDRSLASHRFLSKFPPKRLCNPPYGTNHVRC
jgi:hypothetical protein